MPASELDRIRTALAELRTREAEQRHAAAQILARLGAASERTRMNCVTQLDRDLEIYQTQVEIKYPAALAAWTSPAWLVYEKNALNASPFALRLGGCTERASFSERADEIPQMAPLINARGALLFLCNADTRQT